ncbi:Queuine tRNA-ribosyltransferase subunit qtrtd1 [Mortierella claussenii]|nr:Queuine tRNA-ribosyltransferase subunit qtrtd1 [Mortierella claussenii]
MSPLNFLIQSTTQVQDALTPRHGTLSITRGKADQHGQKKRDMETPGCFMFSIKGSVPHLTPDTMRLQSYGGVSVSLEQLLQADQPLSFDSKWPTGGFTLANYLHLEDYILLCDQRDPSYTFPSLSPTTSSSDASTRKVGANTDRHVHLSTPKGVRPLTLENYLKVVRQYRPDIMVAMADNLRYDRGRQDVKFKDTRPDQKKVRKSIDRTLKWLDQILQEREGKDGMLQDRTIEKEKKERKERRDKRRAATAEGREQQDDEPPSPVRVPEIATEAWEDVALFAHVQGGDFEEERIRSAVETGERKGLNGFIIDAGSVALSTSSESDKEAIWKDITVSLKHLPPEKPKMVYGVHAPEDILRAVQLGADLFDTSYPYQLTEDGKASLYHFGPSAPPPSAGAIDSNNRWLNMWDEEHSDQFVPLLEGCECYACHGGRHTRAYINHLLKTHEMLATVLLMSHNMFQYAKFFTDVRESIKTGTLDVYTTKFDKQYGVEPLRTSEKHPAQLIVEAALTKRNQRLEVAEPGLVEAIVGGASIIHTDDAINEVAVKKRPEEETTVSKEHDSKKMKKNDKDSILSE